MSAKTLNSCTLTSKRTASINSSTTEWIRNPSWLTLPTVSPSEQKIVGLAAVWPNSPNFVGVQARVVNEQISGYWYLSVDWGNGYSIDYLQSGFGASNGAYQEFNYNDPAFDGTDAPVTLTDSGDLITRSSHGYRDGMIVRLWNIVSTTGIDEGDVYYVINSTQDTFQISKTYNGSTVTFTTDGTATLLPYKQAIVTMVPQETSSGNVGSFRGINFSHKYSDTTLTAGYCNPWLELIVSGPDFCKNSDSMSLMFSTGYPPSAPHLGYLEKLTLVNTGNVSSITSGLSSCPALKSVIVENAPSLTSLSLTNCYNLEHVSLNNMPALNSMSGMFKYCTSLKTVVINFNTTLITNTAQAFMNCFALTTVSLFNTQAVTISSEMFSGCNALQSVPKFDLSAVIDMSQMFNGCVALKSIPDFNTVLAQNMSRAFYSCNSLQTAPNLNTVSATNMSFMFNSCYALKSIPVYNTSLVQNMASMFYNCTSLRDIPKLTTPALTNTSSMFYNCYSLVRAPMLTTTNVTTASNMFYNCYSLQYVPAYNFAGITSSANLNYIFSSCYSLSGINAYNFPYTFTVSNCKLSAAGLNKLYTGLPTKASQTITVGANPGISFDDPTIATGKGWTVSGS